MGLAKLSMEMRVKQSIWWGSEDLGYDQLEETRGRGLAEIKGYYYGLKTGGMEGRELSISIEEVEPTRESSLFVFAFGWVIMESVNEKNSSGGGFERDLPVS